MEHAPFPINMKVLPQPVSSQVQSPAQKKWKDNYTNKWERGRGRKVIFAKEFHFKLQLPFDQILDCYCKTFHNKRKTVHMHTCHLKYDRLKSCCVRELSFHTLSLTWLQYTNQSMIQIYPDMGKMISPNFCKQRYLHHC